MTDETAYAAELADTVRGLGMHCAEVLVTNQTLVRTLGRPQQAMVVSDLRRELAEAFLGAELRLRRMAGQG